MVEGVGILVIGLLSYVMEWKFRGGDVWVMDEILLGIEWIASDEPMWKCCFSDLVIEGTYIRSELDLSRSI